MKHFNKLFFSSLLIVSSAIYAQGTIDYNKIRNQTVLHSCTITNSDTVELTLKNLLALDTLLIKKGLDNYFYDLGMTYYIKGYMGLQKEYKNLAITTFRKCTIINSKRGDAYYNLSLIYLIEKNYSQAKVMLILYKKHTRKKFWDKDLIDLIEKS